MSKVQRRQQKGKQPVYSITIPMHIVKHLRLRKGDNIVYTPVPEKSYFLISVEKNVPKRKKTNCRLPFGGAIRLVTNDDKRLVKGSKRRTEYEYVK